MLERRELRSLEACRDWCQTHVQCQAAVVSPVWRKYRECILVSTKDVARRNDWYTLVLSASECSG